MAEKLTRSTFGGLLTPVHKKIFFDCYNEKKKQYDKTFKVDYMEAKEATFPHLGAFGKWMENTEGSDFNKSDISAGKSKVFVAQRYDNSYEVTWELCQDDQYNVFKGAGKGGSAQKLARGLAATEETKAASVIINGFSIDGYDDTPLFSPAHPLINSSETCDNVVYGVLNDENLKTALTKMRLQTDEAGVLVAAHADRLVVHPDWEFTARALVGSTLQAGTDKNDINTIPGLDILVWDYLADDTSGNKIWYIQDGSMDNLLFLWREKPIFDSEKIDNKMDYRFYGYCRFDCGYVDWRGLVGGTGVAV